MIDLRLPVFVFIAATLAFSGFTVMAQEVDVPELPPPLQNLAAEGAQIRYLGRNQGLDGWITVKRGQEQYFYVTPDGKGIVMGLLFDNDGKLVTVRQIQSLQGNDGDLLDMLAADRPADKFSGPGVSENKELRSPAEKMFASVESSNWVAFGNEAAPFIYVFVDPKCPYCRAFLNDLKEPYIDTGKIQVRIIPVGGSEETVAQSAFLIAAPDPEERWYAHAAGDKTALPAKKDINTQAVQMNLGIIQAWKFDAAPVTIYRDSLGKVKIIRGRPNDVHALAADLAG